MRADRLLAILLLLQVRGRMTASELARRLEVSERTIHRDMVALSTAGVPVVAERGAGGGWGLLEAYRTNLTGLNLAEVQALFVTQPPSVLADLGLGQAAETALIKLLAALPTVQRAGADYVRQRIHIDTTGWRRSEESLAWLPALQDILWQERKTWLAYRRSDGTTVERRVDPLGLVAKGSAWYFVAAVDGEPRTYRVSRVQGVQSADEPCVRPEGFDLPAFWARSSAEFIAGLPSYLAVLRADPAAVEQMRVMWRFAHLEEVSSPADDGWVTARVRFEVPDEACQYVLSLGGRVRVIEPDELQAAVIQRAREVLAGYDV